MGVICENSNLFEYGFRAYCLSVALRGARGSSFSMLVSVRYLHYSSLVLSITLSLDSFFSLRDPVLLRLLHPSCFSYTSFLMTFLLFPICVHCSCSPAFDIFHYNTLHFSYLPLRCLATGWHIFKACGPSPNIITTATRLCCWKSNQKNGHSKLEDRNTLAFAISSPHFHLHRSTSELRHWSC